MKNILIFFFLSVINTSYSQDAPIIFDSPKTFSFLHEKLMDANQIERYTSRILTDCVQLESISFVENKVVLIMKNNVSEADINNAIIYCINKFGFTSYKITEL